MHISERYGCQPRSLESIVACLDLHQDTISPVDRAAAYHYAFGDLTVYGKIVEAIIKIVPVLSNVKRQGVSACRQVRR